MRTISTAERVIRILAAVVLAWVLSIHDTWAVFLLMLVPPLWLAVWGPRPLPGRRPGPLALTAALALGLAFVLHLAAARALGGTIPPLSVLWVGWLLLGCLLPLELIGWLIERWAHRTDRLTLGYALRLTVLVLIVLAGAPAVLQTVRAKTHYELPPEARALDPVTFETTTPDGLTVRGYYFDRGQPTTLVFAHGIGAHAENFMVPYVPRLLRRHDVNALIFDFRAHGYSAGHVSSFGYHERHDLRAALRWLRDRHPEAARNLIFYGFSMGSAAAIPVAAETPETRGIIIDSGFGSLTAVARAMVQQVPPGVRQYVYYTALPLAALLCEAPLWAIAPAEDLEQFDRPVLVMHGGADRLIPPDTAEPLRRHPNVTSETLPGASHTNLPLAGPAYFEQVDRFIERLIDDTPPPDNAPQPEPPDNESPTGSTRHETPPRE